MNDFDQLAEELQRLRSANGAPRENPREDPINIFDAQLGGAPELPTGVLPPVIERFARDEAARIGVDPALIAMGAISTTAAAIDDEFKVQVAARDSRWLESARVWAMIVDEVGAKKTPALNAAVDPLRHIERVLDLADTEAWSAYKIEEGIHKRKLDAYEKARANGKEAQRPQAPFKPPRRRLLTTDFTPEALADVLITTRAAS
jgi:hypothetical protein